MSPPDSQVNAVRVHWRAASMFGTLAERFGAGWMVVSGAQAAGTA